MTEYQSGFGNSFETEALPGALPVGRNSPQRCAYGLYAEQLSGSPFTAPRAHNERSWLYRIRPSVAHSGRFTAVDTERVAFWRTAPDDAPPVPIAQMRWNALPITDEATFITGIRTITTGGDAGTRTGFACSVYLITNSMVDSCFTTVTQRCCSSWNTEMSGSGPNSASSTRNPARSSSSREA